MRDFELGITTQDSLVIANGGTIQVVLKDSIWTSTMTVTPGIAPQLGGTLAIGINPNANPVALVGTTFDLFNWPSALAPGNQFTNVIVPPGTLWDLTRLYTTGEVTLLSILSGDYNLDGIVDASDLSIWRSCFGSTTNLVADGNNDGIVDAADYTVWRDQLGSTLSFGHGSPFPSDGLFTTAVPEPTTFAILILAIAGASLRRH